MRESTFGPKPKVCTVKGLCEHLICVDSFFSAFSGALPCQSSLNLLRSNELTSLESSGS